MIRARAARAVLPALLAGILALPAFASCNPDRVEFRGAQGVSAFTIEVARTEAERERGLMGRNHLAHGRGMLFLFPRPGRVTFWMHDTHIPLDMVFVDAAGRVTGVHANAKPMDDSLIRSGPGVLAAPELNPGA